MKGLILLSSFLIIIQGFAQTSGSLHITKPLETSPAGDPEILTPDGDGVNDDFRCLFNNMEMAEVYIVDDKKTILFQSSDKQGAVWNGTNQKGKAVKNGIYYYSVNCTGIDGRTYEKKGRIKLER